MAVFAVTVCSVFTNLNRIFMKEIIKYGSHDILENSWFVRFENQGKYGLKDRNGEIVIPAEYDCINTSGWAGRG